MKDIKARKANKTDVSKSITNPEYRTKKDGSGKTELILGYVDINGNQRRALVSKDIWLYTAGNKDVGFEMDGLDRLMNTHFRIHLNRGKETETSDGMDTCIGIDVAESRLYRSGVVPTKMEGVKTLKLSYEIGGKIVKLLQRPFNTSHNTTFAVIDQVNKILAAEKSINETTKLGNIGRVVGVVDNVIEIRLSAIANSATSGGMPMDAEAIADSAD